MKDQKRLKNILAESSRFAVIVELTGGPNYNFSPIEKFLKSYQENQGRDLPSDFILAGITLPQNPGGVANIDPSDVIAVIEKERLAGDLDIIPHITSKDANTDSLTSTLAGYRRRGIESILALTGDKPTTAQGVFEVESIGLLSLIKQHNQNTLLNAKPGGWNQVHQFYAGAAVSPFKYTEPSLMQQYYKMEKKIAAGAEFLITQVGWDWKKSLELMQYLKENRISIPVIGNVYWLSTLTPAPRLMHDIKLPGCFVSDALLAQLQSESVDQHIDRAAQQIAMYRAIGATGVDVGGVHDYPTFVKILQRAAEIGTNWQPYKDNLYWPAEKTFYLYEDNGRQASLSKPCKKCRDRFFDFMHLSILDPDYPGFHVFKKTLKLFGAQKESNFTYKAFNAIEKSFKYLMFECQECGDCYLPENFGYCTIGECEKGMDNAPCGDATVEGYCGNNLNRLCIGEYIYNSASAHKNGREKLRQMTNKPRIPSLEHTSSLVNYLFGKDHTMRSPLIQIAEAIHASIPKTGKIMKELHALGADAYTRPSGPLDYVRALIETQADEGADYIAVNLDAFGEDNPDMAVEMMKEYVKLVRQWGKGIPVCVDSSNDDVLIAGLKEWYNTDQPVRPPQLNSIKLFTADKMMPLKKQYDFCFIGLLVTEDKAKGPGGSHSVEELFDLAQQIYAKAMQYGFKASEIFFDSTVFPIAIDMPMEPGVPGYTYRAFETIKRIKSDPKLKHCHCSLGVSNCCRDLPGRKIGICRAYVAKAMECGLDAGIVNTSHQYGLKEVDEELLQLISAYAAMDGSPEKLNEAMTRMGQFCASTRKPT
ncbi:MAG TPA: methylenetetrahydrofolate reductase C-terminal domain-containing protein [Anaerohalosphaeraceae bacterium]|jgi:methylenetetrahydrofolate reductase (NADPH)|nr:methylenetetrahydrofolate reductase C-terminal domain-containing protein [Anaerohalosphaeraceae bacterium]